MKITLYMDVYQGWKPDFACANGNPTWEKPAGGRRLAFDVEIPDHLIRPEIDVKVQETSIAREVK